MIKPIIPKLLIRLIDVVRKDYDLKFNEIIINMMDRIFKEILPTIKKEDWVLIIKINENVDLFNTYPTTILRDNSMEGILIKINKSIRELNGKTETRGEELALSTLQKIASKPELLLKLK